MGASATRSYSYDRVAWCYDALASVYSLGAIPAARAVHLEAVESGQQVLYAGVGRGRESVSAAARGARVTGVDCSPRMLARLERDLAARGLAADLRCEDVLGHRPSEPYDHVVANFFLNVFGEAEVGSVLSHLASLLRPGGRLWIADFAPLRGVRGGWGLEVAYYRPVNLAAWALGLCALHPVYDYTLQFPGLGLELVERQPFAPLRRGPALYETIGARLR